ncbi:MULTISPECIES: amidohydrolase family protein [Rhizobium]|uniref:Amidohydrolase-related domain-containing protein n=1 Tax=Rhizobium binae TaxID=1138190 RepID=A0ABV2MPC7_9HYPH|nr:MULTISPECIES: amidohydrolase family protein [Rhizobium]NKL49634.1 amidohydrolase family protein [Rhizobium leguminosarum bv. viciae]MBX4937023.1 amidohydrolase family protein [Rhizobium binae]MBX4943673.1 amidohydrolase family protein [Rhizobium binae]MBX4979117.1 amidohydrolase family protein [Rhizobium binae]MBX4995854.1 amidohydrolase family protein [Rhizobium binae]
MNRSIESNSDSVRERSDGGSYSSRRLKHLPVFLRRQQPEFERIFEVVDAMALDDTHCHLVTDRDAITTPKRFLERISLAGYPFPAYFPPGIYENWLNGDEATKYDLNKQYDIQSKVDEMTYHLSESIFIKFLTKEMAQFLDCQPTLAAVIEARNERGKNYWSYVNSLFGDVNYENIIHDTGFMDGAGQAEIDAFEEAIQPCRSHRIARIEALQDEFFGLDITFEEFESKYTARLLEILDGDGNYGKKSVGMKSYLLPDIGLIRPLYDRGPAANSWSKLRASYSERPRMDREDAANITKDLCRYTFTLTLEECLKRDLPMQIHTGDGEAPYVILRNQDPFYLEEVVRFDKDNMMRMPKIVPLHAGYPSVGKAAWLSHLYPNCYFELSIMTPFVHQSLYERYKQVLEAVPLSKILFASDNYHVPELFWVSGRWGKRYLSQTLTDYVVGGSLTLEEAIEAARMILYKNNRRLYKLRDE